MKSLDPPKLSATIVFDSAISRKIHANRETLKRLRSDILKRYEEYFDNAYALEKVTANRYSDKDRDAMSGCYAREAPTVKLLAEEIYKLNSEIHQCQYCGLSPADTLDHYLPKEIFPEYAVLPINLLPCCSDCNRIKSQNYLYAGLRMFLNFYFDEIGSVPILHASIKMNRSVPITRFHVVKYPELRHSDFRLYASHFKNLDLSYRYSKMASGEIQHCRSLAVKESKLVCDENEFLKRLLLSARTNKTTYGTNYWRVAFYQEAAKNRDFQSYCLENPKF